MRFILTHLHIFKNAGTTIEDILRSTFGESFVEYDKIGSLLEENISWSEMLNYLQSNPKIFAISSHKLRYPFYDTDMIKFIDICFFRHPLNRLFSMYKFYLRSKEAHDTYFSNGTRFADFLEFMILNQPFNTINSQTCFLATGGDYYFPPNEMQFQVAIKRMSEIRFLGLVEDFTLSCFVGQHLVKPIIKRTLSYNIPARNQSRHKFDDLELPAKIEALRKSEGKIIDFILRENAYDIELCSLVLKEIKRRAKIIPFSENE